MKSKIYKICDFKEWKKLQKKGFFMAKDRFVGFIHFSTKKPIKNYSEKTFQRPKKFGFS